MKVYLTGMPECKIGLNDKLMMNAEARSGPALEGGRTSPAMRAGKSTPPSPRRRVIRS